MLGDAFHVGTSPLARSVSGLSYCFCISLLHFLIIIIVSKDCKVPLIVYNGVQLNANI